MRRHNGLHRFAVCTVLMALLPVAMTVLPQSITIAQSKSASIISLNTDKASYSSNEMVTITLVVSNTGNSAIQILCNIDIINPTGTQVYNYSRKYDLASVATNSYEFYWTIPNNAVTGNYQVKSTIADGNDGRFYSSRSTGFIRSNPAQSPQSASLLNLSTDKNSYQPGEVSGITVSMLNTGGGDMTVLTAVDVTNPSGIQVYSGVRENRLDRGNTNKVSFTLPIPENATAGTYQVQATIADKSNGTLYGSRSTTLYVQPTANAGLVTTNVTTNNGIPLTDLGFTVWGQYLVTGLLIALAAVVIYILIRNRPRPKTTVSDIDQTELENVSEEEKPEEPQ